MCFITSLSPTLVSAIIGTYFIFNSLMISVQWRLFSIDRWLRLGIIGSIFLSTISVRLVITQFGWNSWILGAVLLTVLIVAQFYLIPAALVNIRWMKVVEVNDVKVWNSKAISQMTNITIKPPRRYGMVQTYFRNKQALRRFTHIESLYHRLWRVHAQASFEYIWKTVLTGVVLIAVLPIQVEWLIYVTLPISLFVFIQVAVSIFSDHFSKVPLFRSLPLDEKGWTSTYVKWAFLGLVPLYFSFIGFAWGTGRHFIEIIIQLAGILVWSGYDLKEQVENRMRLMMNETFYDAEWQRVTGYVLLALGLYQVLVIVLLPLWIGMVQRIEKSNHQVAKTAPEE